jgi:hypothetical protein
VIATRFRQHVHRVPNKKKVAANIAQKKAEQFLHAALTLEGSAV